MTTTAITPALAAPAKPKYDWAAFRTQAWAFTKRLLLTAVLVTVELWAFTLSFNHHVETAIGAGYSPQLAALYPLTIDGAIVASTLVLVWWPALTPAQRAYIWFAIATWTAISGINNAISTLTADTTDLAFPVELAIAIHTVPTVTQFLVLHIVYLALRSDHTTDKSTRQPLLERLVEAINKLRNPPTTQTQEAPRSPKPKAVKAPRAGDIPPVSDEELLAMADGEKLSMQQIATRIGRSKSHVGERVKDLRDKRDGTGRYAEDALREPA